MVTDSKESIFRQIFENIPGLYLVLKPPDYEIVTASESYLNATMSTREDIIGEKFFEVFPPDPEAPQSAGLRQLQTSLEKVKKERQEDAMPIAQYPILSRGSKVNEKRWWNPTNKPILDTSGNVEYIIHYLEDVTPLIRSLKGKKGESNGLQQLSLRGYDVEELKELAYKQFLENEEKYRTLFNRIDEGFCIIKVVFDENENPVGYRFLEVNQAFEKQTGIRNAEGKRMRQIAPNHEEYWFEIYGKVALTREPIRFERPAEALNRHFNVYAFPVGEPESKKVAILFSDISQRKKNNYVNAWLSAIINNSEDAIISKDLNGVITSWNASAERMFGYSEAEAIGRNITMIIPDERLDEETEILFKIKHGERVEHFETIRKHKDGSKLNISLSVSPIRDSDGDIVGASKIARDITRRKRTEEKLKKLNETLEERVEERTTELRAYQEQLRSLASELSKAEEQERHRLAAKLHDNLGQMLAVSKMKLQGIKTIDLPDEAGNEIADLTNLVDEALTFTRELMGELKPPPAFNDQDIKEVLNWVANKMEKRGLNVTIESDHQPKPLSKEIQSTLYQCVRELLYNVIKHADVGEARINLSTKEERLQVIIEDEGKGFNPGKIEPTLIGGFGLFNIRERLNYLGGNIEIFSKPGKGTVVVLEVPLKEVDQTANSGEKYNEPFTSEKSEKKFEMPQRVEVMLVDDHEMVRKGFRKLIEEENDLVIIAEASDGKEAVKLARETFPDVIVMDVNMPDMDGIEATRQITFELPDIRIIGLSLENRQEVARNIKSAGASAYLTKGEAFETLCATIRAQASLTTRGN